MDTPSTCEYLVSFTCGEHRCERTELVLNINYISVSDMAVLNKLQL